ncbi:MAG: alpha/beta hydrolase [Gordonia sp.]|nr:alpha/beta hydrolase [Gordonia sp. (in: high G+C Gram-positive bacteria)]
MSRTVGLRRSTVETSDGALLAVQEGGPDTGPALLLLAGQANSHRWWTGIRDHFEQRFRTISFDYRGAGDTRAEESSTWSTTLFADDAAQVLATLGVDSAHVYGTSMGGRVAQMLAIDHPLTVDQLVLACTTTGGTLAVERDNSVRRALAQQDSHARVNALLELMYTPAWFAPGRRSHLLGDPDMSARAQLLHLRTSGGHDAVDRLCEIRSQTLILHGSDDLMAPVVNAHRLGDAIRDSRVEITTGGRHGFFDEFADSVSAQVIDFLDDGL